MWLDYYSESTNIDQLFYINTLKIPTNFNLVCLQLFNSLNYKK